MSDPLSLATLLAKQPLHAPAPLPLPLASLSYVLSQPQPIAATTSQPELSGNQAEFSQPARSAPKSNIQLYAQRLAALTAGRLYTRLPIDSFQEVWSQAKGQPTYEQWQDLLSLEAKAVAGGQGQNRLSVIVGDSLSMWFPSDRLPPDQLWLNQAISGDTTRGVLQRLPEFDQTRPSTVYVMAGINDLKRGASDREILGNLQAIVQRLRSAHPQAQIIVQSILPTRLIPISNSRIRQINQALRAIVQRNGARFLDLHPFVSDKSGALRQVLTTDGLHLSPRGYRVWQWALRQSEMILARSGA